MFAWLPQASYPCGNFSDTSTWYQPKCKGSRGHAFTVRTHTESQNQASLSPFGPQEVSVLFELALGHLRCCLTDVPPQPNSQPEIFFPYANLLAKDCLIDTTLRRSKQSHIESSGISRTPKLPLILHLPSYFTSQTRVKLNRVFFPR